MSKPINTFRWSVARYIALAVIVYLYLISIAAAGPSIANISVKTKGYLVKMNADLLEGMTESILEAIHSGIPVTFTYQIELLEIVPFWTNRVVSRNTISNTIQYDSLKKVYRFSSIGRKIRRRVVTRDVNRYQRLMTTLKSIPIASVKKLE